MKGARQKVKQKAVQKGKKTRKRLKMAVTLERNKQQHHRRRKKLRRGIRKLTLIIWGGGGVTNTGICTKLAWFILSTL